MRSINLSVLVALTNYVIATPLGPRSQLPSIFGDQLDGYLKGFENPRIDASIGGKATCISGTINITTSAKNVLFKDPEVSDQSSLTEFLLEGFQVNSTRFEDLVSGQHNVSGTYGIYSQLCFPNGVINTTTVQFLTHGLLGDRSYWNNAPRYSYVDHAAERGHTTFLYDRLGSGLSDHPDPLQIVQAQMHVAIGHQLIQLLRTGGIASTEFRHVVGVGHSFGSFQTLGIATQHPEDLDAVVLTGFSTNTAGMPLAFSSGDITIAAQAVPTRFSGLPNGYLTFNNIIGIQFGAMRAPGFDPALLNLLADTRGIITTGELLTSTSLFSVAENFTGPIDIALPEHDLPSCFANCYLPHNQAASIRGELFPAASNTSSWYIAPGVGHFLNYHYGAIKAYDHIQAFIQSNDL